MLDVITQISIDLTALPVDEPVYERLFTVVKKRIEDRCGATCVRNVPDAPFVLHFSLVL